MKNNVNSLFLAFAVLMAANIFEAHADRREYSQDRVLRDFSDNPVSTPVMILPENSYLERPIDFRKNELNSNNSTASRA